MFVFSNKTCDIHEISANVIREIVDKEPYFYLPSSRTVEVSLHLPEFKEERNERVFIHAIFIITMFIILHIQ